MNLLVIWFQLSGVIIGFVTLRILVIPLFERAPVMLDDQLTSKEDHAVVCEYGRGKSVLLDELDSSEIEYVLVDSNKEEAIDLSNRDYQVIDGDPTELATLERASVEKASFVVTDARERNASIALTVRQLTTDARVDLSHRDAGPRECIETDRRRPSGVFPWRSSGGDWPGRPRHWTSRRRPTSSARERSSGS
jgi:hypothetical protein